MGIDLLWLAFGFLLTLMIFSYIFGDNPLFRLAVYLFVGVTTGYAAAVAIRSVLWPQIGQPFFSGNLEQILWLALPALLLSLLLLMKIFPRVSFLGDPVMAFLVGVGVATAIGGALFGTLFPQTMATVNLAGAPDIGGLLEGAISLIGVVSTLAYFHFGARPGKDAAPRRSPVVQSLATIGGIFIAIALGVIFAGVYAAALTALVDRASALVQFIQILLGLPVP